MQPSYDGQKPGNFISGGMPDRHTEIMVQLRSMESLLEAIHGVVAIGPVIMSVDEEVMKSIDVDAFTPGPIMTATQGVSIERHISAIQISRLKDAIEGECDGLAIDDKQAISILRYIFSGVAA